MSIKVIAYDVGTTGLKACLFAVSTEKGVEYIASTVEDYSLHMLGGGAIEQEPDDWWTAMCRSTKHLMQQTGVNRDEIRGVCFCSQMQNVLMVDEKGVPLRPCISWMDTRADLQFNRCMNTGLKVEGMNLFKILKFLRITGAGSFGSKDPVWKYLWVRDNEPEIFEKTYKWLDAKEYLACRATGVMKASRDTAGATFLYDVKNDCWSEELCRMTGVEMRHLPEICASTDAGCTDIGDVNVYSGTSGWVETTVGKLHTDIGNLIGTLPGADPTVYNYVAEVDTSGKCMEWVKDRLDLQEMSYPELDAYIQDVPAGNNGVIFSPATAARLRTRTRAACSSTSTSIPVAAIWSRPLSRACACTCARILRPAKRPSRQEKPSDLPAEAPCRPSSARCLQMCWAGRSRQLKIRVWSARRARRRWSQLARGFCPTFVTSGS